MKILLSAILVLGLGAGTLPAQDEKQLTDAELKKLTKVFIDVKKAEADRGRRAARNRDKANTAFQKEIEKLQKKYGENELVLMEDSWRKVFVATSARDKKAKMSGEGRVTTRTVNWKSNGATVGAEYAVRVPKGYARGEAWPVIICLHDTGDGEDGEKYLKEVWDKVEGIDNYLLIAPTIGKKTVGKRAGDQQRINRRDINDLPHLRTCFRVLNDVLTNFKVDYDRIFIEGTGQGATTAVDLAIAQPKRFAGVAARSGVPAQTKFLGNLRGITPIMFVDREGGVWSKGDGAVSKGQVTQMQQDMGLDIAFKNYPTVDNPAQQRKNKGKGKNDRIPEASADIAAFFADKKRNLAPDSLTFATWNSRFFKRSAWLVLLKAGGVPSAGTAATFEGLIKDDNTIEVTTTEVEVFSIYAGSWVDLSKPVKVVVNGKVAFNEVVQPSLDAMLKYYKGNTFDPTQIIVGTMRINVPLEEEPEEGDK